MLYFDSCRELFNEPAGSDHFFIRTFTGMLLLKKPATVDYAISQSYQTWSASSGNTRINTQEKESDGCLVHGHHRTLIWTIFRMVYRRTTVVLESGRRYGGRSSWLPVRESHRPIIQTLKTSDRLPPFHVRIRPAFRDLDHGRTGVWCCTGSAFI